MRSESTRRILNRTTAETKLFVRKYASIILRINQLLRDKNLTQAALADKMGKKPSEVSRWLSGEHNLTLRSICKIEAELECDIISVILNQTEFESVGGVVIPFEVWVNPSPPADTKYTGYKPSRTKQPEYDALAS
ncbi:MAG: helix-turn-helix transcriptional regulator [Bacteroidetes bacterium]|nr:helix-turn-helix transcriptional regulator [Bacteroidota bacterium]